MSGIFSGGDAEGARAQNMTAKCGKSNGDRICFDIWINRPKFVNRIRVDRSAGSGVRRRVASQSAEERRGEGQIPIVK